jgi:hypothetical protein
VQPRFAAAALIEPLVTTDRSTRSLRTSSMPRNLQRRLTIE